METGQSEDPRQFLIGDLFSGGRRWIVRYQKNSDPTSNDRSWPTDGTPTSNRQSLAWLAYRDIGGAQAAANDHVSAVTRIRDTGAKR